MHAAIPWARRGTACLFLLIETEKQRDKHITRYIHRLFWRGNVADVSGLIGQYAHGNEPSHQIAYMYSFVGVPWKTQERVKMIVDSMYH